MEKQKSSNDKAEAVACGQTWQLLIPVDTTWHQTQKGLANCPVDLSILDIFIHWY